MYHYKARIYSPYLGRFLQTDPIGYDDQFNLYAYVGNDPVGNVDPSGKFECVINSNGTQTCTSNGSILDNAALALYSAWVLFTNKKEDSDSSDGDSSDSNEQPTAKETKKERRARVKRERKRRRANEPLSEKAAKAKGKKLSEEKRRELHDMKQKGEPDRSREQYNQDLKDVAPTPPTPPPPLPRPPEIDL